MESRPTTIGLVFGGYSGEHEVSIRSATTVIHGLRSGENSQRYRVIPFYIDQEGRWWGEAFANRVLASQKPIEPPHSIETKGLRELPEGSETVQVWYPVLHGPAQPGTEYSRYRLQFFEPYLSGSDNSLKVSAFRSVLLRSNYTEDRNSAGITLGRLFDREEKLRGEIGFRVEGVTVENISSTAPSVITDSAGKTPVNALDFRFDWDRRVFRPDVGAVNGWNFESTYSRSGGFLGGDLDINKVDLSYGWFKTVFQETDEMRHVFAFKTSLGYAHDYDDTDFIPIFERYFLGGPRSLRGFDYRGAGPTEDGVEIGGTVRHYGSLDYTWPLLENSMRGTVFADFGNLSEDINNFEFDEYRLGVGGGVILYVPLFGQRLPISITWTEAILKQDSDETREFSFDLGWVLR